MNCSRPLNPRSLKSKKIYSVLSKNYSKGKCLSKPDRQGPVLKINPHGGLLLSGQSLGELLQAVLERGASFRLKASGYSMSPFIKDGDMITLSSTNPSVLHRGQVVAFVHPETKKFFVHRIIDIKDDFFITKGDKCMQVDGPISGQHILGVVTAVERRGNKINLGLKAGKGLISFLSGKKLLHPLRRFLRKALKPFRL